MARVLDEKLEFEFAHAVAAVVNRVCIAHGVDRGQARAIAGNAGTAISQVLFEILIENEATTEALALADEVLG